MKGKKFIKLGVVSLLAVFISLTSIFAVKATTNSVNESKNNNTLYEQTCETTGEITFSREEVESSYAKYSFSYLPEELCRE